MAPTSKVAASREPGPAELRGKLGRSHVHWTALIERLEAELAPLEKSWNRGTTTGDWTLRLRQGKRTVVYLTPFEKYFRAGLVLGEKAVAAAHEASLPAPCLAQLDAAPRYAEGRGVRIEVRNARDLAAVTTLALAKMAHGGARARFTRPRAPSGRRG